MRSISFKQEDVKKDTSATNKKYNFDNWYRLLNQLCEEMFLNTWESLGWDKEESRRFYDDGESVQEVCDYLIYKYDLDDCRKLW